MRKKILQLIVILVAFCQMQVIAQTSQVTGRVVGPDNAPVPNATVNISGSQQGTVTDDNGNFSLQVPAGASLLITSVNFTDQVVKVDGRSVINVSLQAGNSSGLDEVVVTGYTTEKKKDIIGSVAIVNMAAAKSVPSGAALSAIQGQASGVNVINNGSPGRESSVLIRGLTSFGTAPLVLIDGMQGQINDVPAVDVESIQVLKDGAAAIYGARGGNGVIVITTKKGKSGAPSVIYDSYYNLQFPKSLDKLDLLTTEQWQQEYLKVNSQADDANGLFPGGVMADYLYRKNGGVRGAAFEGANEVKPELYNLDLKNFGNSYIISKLYKGNDFQQWDALMNPALMMQHNVTASGGNDRANYLLSLGYLDHQGTLNNSSLKRYNVRINSTYKLTNHIRIGENVNLTYKNNPQFSANGGFGPIETAIQTPRFMPLYDIAGNFAGNFAGPEGQVAGGNGFAKTETIYNNRYRDYNIAGNVFVEIDFLKNFTFRSSAGGFIDYFYNQTFTPREYWTENGGSANRLEENSGFSTVGQWTNTLNYRKQFGLHSLNALAGIEAVESKNRAMYSYSDNFLFENYNYLVLGQGGVRFPGDNKRDYEQIGDRIGSDGLYSQFGKVDYSYNDKYLVGGTLRRDGFSRFGSQNQFGTFFSVALGWRLSQESFMKNVAWVNDLKIRASYGELGNKESVPAGNAYSTFGTSPQFSYYAIGGGNTLSQGFYPQRLGNSRTSWETNKVTNIGFDATLFNNKLDVTFEYYKKTLDGLLRQQQLPQILGEASSPYINFGDIENKGIDVSATYRARVSREVNISVGANFTTYKNEIIQMPEPGFYLENNRSFQEGSPMSTYYGYKITGIFREQKDLDGIVQDGKDLGRWMYEDIDGNDTINTLDRQIIGNPNPKWTLGINLGATWKNFDFSAILYAAVGQDVFNGIGRTLGSWERGATNKSSKVLDAWSVDNPDGTWKKSEQGQNFSNSGEFNDAFMEKGSFLRLRNVQIGFTLPGSKLGKTGLSKLRIYVGGTNLFCITKYSGLDPEVLETGVAFRGEDAGAYVQQAGIVGGLQVTF